MGEERKRTEVWSAVMGQMGHVRPKIWLHEVWTILQCNWPHQYFPMYLTFLTRLIKISANLCDVSGSLKNRPIYGFLFFR